MTAARATIQGFAGVPAETSFGIRASPDSGKAYECFVGGTGREIYHRMQRTEVASLLAGCSDLVHEVQFRNVRGLLVNYALDGIAFSLPSSVELRYDEVIEELRVVIGDEIVYHGAAMVRYTQPAAHKRIAGVVLLDGTLDLELILSAKVRATSKSTMSAIARVGQSDIGIEYKRVLADAVFLMNSYRRLLDGQERSLSQSTPSATRSRTEQEMLAAAEMAFRNQYEPLRRSLNVETAGLPVLSQAAYKRYTESMMHPAVLCAPAAYRCYEKPLGYPGDFILMSYLYNEERLGDSLYAKLIHQVVVREEPLAQAVRTRKDFMLGLIREAATQAACQSRRARIMSLGCGPAQEVTEFISTNDAPEIVLTLVDQDQRSLTSVNSSLSRLLVPRRAPMPIQYLYVGFRQLLARRDLFDAIEMQDLIYTAGLFDYVGPKIAQRLAQRLFAKLRVGGTLAIGNFKGPNDATWSLNYWMDWPLIYRSGEDMADIGRFIEQGCEKRVAVDRSGYTLVLLIRKI